MEQLTEELKAHLMATDQQFRTLAEEHARDYAVRVLSERRIPSAVAPLIVIPLATVYGWRMPFLVSAAPGVVIAILIFFFVREPERGSADRLQATPMRTTIAGMLTNPGYWTATLGMAMLVFTMGGISLSL